METTTKIGFIGLGTMGKPMAWNLHQAGFDLGVYNRTRKKAKSFKSEGVKVYGSPKKLAKASDVIIMMVTDSDALVDLLMGAKGILSGLQRDAIVINMSTVSRESNLEAADAVQLEKARFVEAPVSGTKKPAEDGTLTVLAGGDKNLVDELDPLFRAMGDTVLYCGELGQATNMKLTINLLLGGMMQVFAEALVFGQKQGLDIDGILENISSGPLQSPLFEIKGQLIKERNFEKNFPVDLLLKDLNLVLDAAQQKQVFLPAVSAVREAVNGTQSLGHGDEDMAAVVKLLEKVSS